MKTKVYVVVVCLIGLPGFLNLLFQGIIAMDYWVMVNPAESMIHRALIGAVNEQFLAIGSMCSVLFLLLITPILLLVARNGAKMEELEKERQLYYTAKQELEDARRKYIELFEHSGESSNAKFNKVESSNVYVIMPKGVGNVLAWSSCCWPSREAAQHEIDNTAQGDEEYRKKYWIQTLNIMPQNKQ